ncbi:MAG: hypothetical protein ACTSWA_10800, partial [Candidatus Thorarchaeota archaeon]
MNNDDWSIISNVFAGSLSFSDVSQELDAFKLEGIGSGGSKYGIVGKVIGKLSWENKTPFEYYSVKGKAYAVGFLNREPVQDQVDVSSARA